MSTTWGWLVLLFPLLGSIAIGLGFRVWSQRTAGLIGIAAVGLAFASALAMLICLLGDDPEARHHASSLWTYADAGGVDIQLGIYIDPLSVFMALIVSGVSTLIHIYSYSYMKSDAGYRRFFSYLNFFVFSMLLLVLAGNFVLLIVGWGLVGFASYALISYWYRRETATKAGMKAFVINVVGDIGLVLAAFLIFRELGVFDYTAVFNAAPEHFTTNDSSIFWICMLILVGAFAKSAQIPFHTWLPDAMEGPTPVSSLIHAATMVTAGVYLIARCHPLFELAPTAADISAVVGTVTLLVAGTIAVVVTDLKRVIAYSTMSQIGYMILGVSIGAYSAGLFHLMTHAFFKALLFMAAGSIIAAMANDQNIDRMKGLGKVMPFTAATMIIGSLALAGFPGTSGFFSKDEILSFADDRGGLYTWLAIAGYVGAFLTAIYSFRLVFRVLWGDPCDEAKELKETGHVAHGEPVNPATGEAEDTDIGFPGPDHHIAEQAGGMKFAMAVLAFLALVGGLVQIPGLDDVVTKFLEPTFADSPLSHIEPSTSHEWFGLGIGAIVSVIGIGVAYLIYVVRPGTSAALEKRFGVLHDFFFHKWYFDEAIDFLVVRPALATGSFANRVFERYVVNGIVAGAVDVVRGSSGVVKTVQSGFVRAYALLLIAGFAGLVLYFLIVSN